MKAVTAAKTLLIITIALSLTNLCPAAPPLPRYEIIDLGAIAGGARSQANDINDAGQVVGTAQKDILYVPYFTEEQARQEMERTLYSHQQNYDLLVQNGWMTHLEAQTRLQEERDFYEAEIYEIYVEGRYIPVDYAFVWDAKNGLADLGTLGGDQSTAYSINNSGTVIGQALLPVEPIDPCLIVPPFIYRVPVLHAFQWNEKTGMIDLTALGCPPKVTNINNVGQIVGISWERGRGTLPFLWDHTDELTILDTFDGWYGAAYDINQKGEAVGSAGIANDPDRTWPQENHAVMWDEHGNLTDLGTPSGLNSTATAINNSSVVVGYAEYPVVEDSGYEHLANHAFVCNKQEGMIEIHHPDHSGSNALDINDSGTVVGQFWKKRLLPPPIGAPVLATPTITDLHLRAITPSPSLLPPQDLSENASLAIIDRGQIIPLAPYSQLPLGDFSPAQSISNVSGLQLIGYPGLRFPSFAFMWTETSAIIDLNDFLPEDSHWEYLASAKAINNKGQIVGFGITTDGEQHAFLMNPIRGNGHRD